MEMGGSILIQPLSEPPHDAAVVARMNGKFIILGDIALFDLAGLGFACRGSRSGAGSTGRRRSRNEAGDSGSREFVLGTVVENAGIKDAGVAVTVSSGQTNELAGVGGACLRASDAELGTGGIKLGSSLRSGEVECDDLVANEVIPWCKILGDAGCGYSASHQVSLSPDRLAAALLAYFLDLKPFCLGVIELVAGRRAARSHVGQHRTRVMRPGAKACSTPVKGDRVARIGIGDKRSWGGIDTTSQRCITCAFVRVLGGDLANGARPFFAARHVAFEGLAVNGDGVQKAVGRYIGRSEQRDE